MHKDLRGNPIYVGQAVTYSDRWGSTSHTLKTGFVEEIGVTRSKQPEVVIRNDLTRKLARRHPSKVVALPYSNTPTVVAVLVPLPNGDLLGIRRANEPQTGKVALPGGYQMAGETWQEAGAREVLEETGFKIDPKRIELCTFAGTDTYGNNMVFGLYDPPLEEDGMPHYETDGAMDGEVLEALGLSKLAGYEWAFPLHEEAAMRYWWKHLV